MTTTNSAYVVGTASAVGGTGFGIQGGAAAATARIAGASNGYAKASSQTQSSLGSAYTSANSPVGGPASAVTQVSIGTSGIASVPSILAGQSLSTAILSPSTGGALAIGGMSIGYGGSGESLTYTTTAQFSNIAQNGNVLLTFLDHGVLGDGFSSMTLDIVINGTGHNYAWNDLASAETFFSHDTLDFGPYSGNLSLQLYWSLTSQSPGDGFGFDYAIGNYQVSAVPEPSTWAMMIIGFAGLGFMSWRKVRSSKASFA